MENIRLLILGASGLVGGNCLRYFREQEIAVLGTHFSYATPDTLFWDTLAENGEVPAEVEAFAPTHILHAGALTHVDLCEQNPEASFAQTVKSTERVIDFARRLSARIIYISTDYVFDGQSGPYREDDSLNPISVYGRHKLEAEELVKSEPGHLVLRITNVYGDELRNKNFVARLLEAGRTGEPLNLKLPFDQYATPVNAWDIARALHVLLTDAKTGVYHIASTDYLNRVQLAERVLAHFTGHKVSVKPISTSELGQPAARPLQGGLKAHKFLSEYPTFTFSSLDAYLHSKLKT